MEYTDNGVLKQILVVCKINLSEGERPKKAQRAWGKQQPRFY